MFCADIVRVALEEYPRFPPTERIPVPASWVI